MKPPVMNFSIINHGLKRRSFFKGVGAGGALILTAKWSWAQSVDEKKYGGDSMPGGTKDDPKVFITIHQDGMVDITCARSEMGQGIRTSLALVVADELEADWEFRFDRRGPRGSRRSGCRTEAPAPSPWRGRKFPDPDALRVSP